MGAYLMLLLISLPIPLIQRTTDKVIEGLRPVMKMSDGTYERTLMPVPFLTMRWIGHLSWIVLAVVLVFFAFSFFREIFSRFETICALSLCQAAFTTIYALFVVMAFLIR